MIQRFGELAGEAEAVVLAGSLPRRVPVDAYAQLIAQTRSRVVLDADREALRSGVRAEPSVVKIKPSSWRGSLTRLSVASGAAALSDQGAGAVVVSCGCEGLVAVAEDGAWSAAPPEAPRGNPTCAGDAASAAVVPVWWTGVTGSRS